MLRNITMSAEASVIDRARERARRESTTLNEVFRGFLLRYIGQEAAPGEYRGLMDRLSDVQAGAHFTRNDLNER